jgi:GWxTD domain-containing protein
MNRRIVIAALSLFIAVPLFAGLSAKYKDWPSSPQGYFMTSSERAQWATLTSDADAEKFIQQFLAARGGEFPAEVAKRVEMADKYLTIGKTPGSKTLRGKAIILLGPPASLDVRDATEGEGHANARAFGESVNRSGADGGIAAAGGIKVTENMQTSISPIETVKARRYYSFTFRNDIAKKLDKTAIIVNVVADPNSGKDEFVSRGEAPEVEKAFETAAQLSIVKPQS